MSKTVCISASFDDLRTPDIRFLHEASRLGPVHVLLWSDAVIEAVEGKAPKFPLAERQYFVDAIRFVSQITVVDQLANPDQLPEVGSGGTSSRIWTVRQSADTPAKRAFCQAKGIEYQVIPDTQLAGFPAYCCDTPASAKARKKVVVTGCYDWFHSGHVRFFEEVSEYGDLYVCVGNDANLLHLKGPGHPHFCQDERRYVVGSVRFVKQAIISTGMGWMDAEPQIATIKPDIYAVNEDGDKPEKRAFSKEHGLEYLVLKRLPKEGLTRRSSTALRGF
jgi:cytidyltransferase-like protein